MKPIVWFALCAAMCAAQDISGSWEISVVRFGETDIHRMTLQVSGGKLTGTADDLKLEGTRKGGTVEFEARLPDGRPLGTFSGTVQGAAMSGTALWFGKDKIQWKAERVAVRPAGGPKLHDFQPVEFHRYFSGSIPPVLHIFPGDTVHTWTVDAGGADSNGVHRSQGGNPETGPFYVEGALPGDTLVVKLVRLRLNRDTAGSGDSVAWNALTPNYVHRVKYDDKFNSQWTLDRAAGVARLSKPTEKLKNFSIPLAPMLGCIAVAPPGNQTFRSGYLGSFGGNMDYNQMREGTTLYLPVSQKGALLFVGDGHAAQGDGESTGDALETSMDVEFSVDLIPGKSTGMPRAENDGYLMAMGIAGSLDEAFRIATTQLAQWLERDYKLNANEASMILGFAVHYDVGEVVDPQYNVVARVPKTVLARMK